MGLKISRSPVANDNIFFFSFYPSAYVAASIINIILCLISSNLINSINNSTICTVFSSRIISKDPIFWLPKLNSKSRRVKTEPLEGLEWKYDSSKSDIPFYHSSWALNLCKKSEYNFFLKMLMKWERFYQKSTFCEITKHKKWNPSINI